MRARASDVGLVTHGPGRPPALIWPRLRRAGRGAGTSYRARAFLGSGCTRGQQTIIVADLRRSNTRPKQQMNHASNRRSNRSRTIGLRLLSKCNGWSKSAVRNTVVPRQKNLKPRNLRPVQAAARKVTVAATLMAGRSTASVHKQKLMMENG